MEEYRNFVGYSDFVCRVFQQPTELTEKWYEIEAPLIVCYANTHTHIDAPFLAGDYIDIVCFDRLRLA